MSLQETVAEPTQLSRSRAVGFQKQQLELKSRRNDGLRALPAQSEFNGGKRLRLWPRTRQVATVDAGQ